MENEVNKKSLLDILDSLSDDAEVSFLLEGSDKTIKFVDVEAVDDELIIYLEEE